KDKVSNYKPVCSLSPISKIIEKVIYNRIILFLDRYEIISNTQFGFRKNMGSETARLNYIEFLKNELTNYKYIISMLLDHSKAFYVIDHKILEMNSNIKGSGENFWNFS
ncbi:unnamed protein product, partial [Meganyctiphanes norvegica]